MNFSNKIIFPTYVSHITAPQRLFSPKTKPAICLTCLRQLVADSVNKRFFWAWSVPVVWCCRMHGSGFNLSVGCFGSTLSKITPNGQIWEFTGSRMDHSAPNYVARLFYLKKIKKNGNMVQKSSNMMIFVKNNL